MSQLKVLCDRKTGIPVCSGAQVDGSDLCLTQLSHPHYHIDWRFWNGVLESVSIEKDGEVIVVNNTLNSVVSSEDTELVWKDMDQIRGPTKTAVRSIPSFLRLCLTMRGKRPLPLPKEMVDLEAYKGCQICPHKHGLVIDGVCQGHGYVFKEIFPIKIWLAVTNETVTVEEKDIEEFLSKPLTVEPKKSGDCQNAGCIYSKDGDLLAVFKRGRYRLGTADVIRYVNKCENIEDGYLEKSIYTLAKEASCTSKM